MNIKRVPYDHVRSVMDAAREIFTPDNQYGVFSFGIRSKIQKGISRRYCTLGVSVERKSKKAIPFIPPIEYKYEGKIFKIDPDVRATGSPPLLYHAGEIAYNGLHAGGTIRVENGSGNEFGGISCLLARGRNLSHFLTAGHLFDRDGRGTAVFSGDDDQNEVLTGHLAVNLLERTVIEGGDSIDAALVELTPEGIDLEMNSIKDGPELASIGSLNEGSYMDVQSFLPTSNEYSYTTNAGFSSEVTHFKSPGGWRFTVSGVIKTDRLITQAGDSGTILFSRNGRAAIGSCIGECDRLSYFAPIQKSLSELAQLNYHLRLFR